VTSVDKLDGEKEAVMPSRNVGLKFSDWLVMWPIVLMVLAMIALEYISNKGKGGE
jgi:bacteriorhodopsin